MISLYNDLYTTDYGFVRKEHSSCREKNTYGSYGLFMLAEMDCENDPECIGIQDNSQDSKGFKFQLCQKGYITSYATTSVIHTKIRYHGNSHSVFYPANYLNKKNC